MVILHLKRVSKTPQECFRIIRNEPVALNLLISYSKQQDLKLLKELYLTLQELEEVANVFVREAYQQKVN